MFLLSGHRSGLPSFPLHPGQTGSERRMSWRGPQGGWGDLAFAAPQCPMGVSNGEGEEVREGLYVGSPKGLQREAGPEKYQ